MNQTFRMLCSDLSGFSLHKDLSDQYYFRNYKIGESGIWAEIVTSAGEFNSLNDALNRFDKEFSKNESEFSNRTIFIIHKDSGLPIGTASAWYDNNKAEGRLHWVSIRKEYQGRGLARPLIYKAVSLLKGLHKSAYLTTQESSWKAIKIYEDCGFCKTKL